MILEIKGHPHIMGVALHWEMTTGHAIARACKHFGGLPNRTLTRARDPFKSKSRPPIRQSLTWFKARVGEAARIESTWSPKAKLGLSKEMHVTNHF